MTRPALDGLRAALLDCEHGVVMPSTVYLALAPALAEPGSTREALDAMERGKAAYGAQFFDVRSCVQWVLSGRTLNWFGERMEESEVCAPILGDDVRALLEEWLESRAEFVIPGSALGRLRAALDLWHQGSCNSSDLTEPFAAALVEPGSTFETIGLSQGLFTADGRPIVDLVSWARGALVGGVGHRIIGGTFRRDRPGPAYDHSILPPYVAPSVRVSLERWLAANE